MGIIQNALKATALASVLVSGVFPAQARWAGVSPATQSKPHQTSWDISAFAWLRLVPKEKGAADNEHPVKVDAGTLAKLLAPIITRTPEGEEPLFDASELAVLTKYMESALALADPGEDLLLFSGNKRNHGMFSSPLAVVARLYVKDGALNIIVHDTRLEVLCCHLGRFDQWGLETGSRTKATQEVIKHADAHAHRTDWLAIPVPPPAPAVLAARPQEGAPAVTNQEGRLKLLKQLREENLLTEQEYQHKRLEILKTL